MALSSTHPQWFRALQKDQAFLGRRVRSLVELSTQQATFPPGSVFVIRSWYNGLQLKAEPCPGCNVSLHVGPVMPDQVELVS